MAEIFDPEAEKRSLMMAQKVICNGQKTGVRCKYYWRLTRQISAINPDFLREGERVRVCNLLAPGDFIALEEGELPVRCNNYVPHRRSLLQILTGRGDNGAYRPKDEEYNPLSTQDVQKLQEGSRDPRLPTTAAAAAAQEARELHEGFNAELSDLLTARRAEKPATEDTSLPAEDEVPMSLDDAAARLEEGSENG